jgi:hypothetical protein
MADRWKSISDPALVAQECLAAAYLLEAVALHLRTLAHRLPDSPSLLKGCVEVAVNDHLPTAIESLKVAAGEGGTCDL